MLAAMHLALALVFAHPPGLSASLRYLFATTIAYPLVVLGLAWCLRLRAPRMSEVATGLGVRVETAGERRSATHHPPGLMLLGIQAGVIGALGWRMRDLQILQNEHYRLLAEENRVNIRLIPPARGIIDRNGRLLAGTRQNYRIVMVREQAGEPRRCSRGSPASCRCRPTCRNGRCAEMAPSAFVPVVVAEHLTWDDIVRVAANTPVLPG